MKVFKRMLAAMCALAIVLSMGACSETQTDEVETDQSETESETRKTAVPNNKTEKPSLPYTFSEPPLPEGEVVDNIKVMTYNLQGGKPDGLTLAARSSGHAAKINLYDPDLVLLCEARNFDRRDQDLNVGVLTVKCDVPYEILQFPEVRSTNVILYNSEKFECISSEAILLADGGDEYSRSAAIAVLRLKQSGEEIVAVATHLDLNMFAAEVQVREIMDHLAENYSEYDRQIIAGDLNYESFEATLLGSPNTIHENGLIAGGYYSANIDRDRTFTHKTKIIDYIYFRGAYPENYRVVTDVVGDAEPSDHYPVYAELRIYG